MGSELLENLLFLYLAHSQNFHVLRVEFEKPFISQYKNSQIYYQVSHR